MLGLGFTKDGKGELNSSDSYFRFPRPLKYPDIQKIADYLHSQIKGQVSLKPGEYTETYGEVSGEFSIGMRRSTRDISGTICSGGSMDMTKFTIHQKDSEQAVYFIGLEFSLVERPRIMRDEQKKLIKKVNEHLNSYFKDSQLYFEFYDQNPASS